MMLSRQRGAVAEWAFLNGPVRQLTWSTLERSLAACEATVSALASHKLLAPHTIALSIWMTAGDQEVARSARTDLQPRHLVVDPTNYSDTLIRACRSILDRESVYPLEIEVSGTGVVFTEDGERVVDDLVWVRGETLDTFEIRVGTQSDVWMPHSLSGVAQPDLFRLNADRLERSLELIAGATGFVHDPEVQTHYAVANRFRLNNLRYPDGSIVDVC